MNKIGISNDKMKEAQEVLHAYTSWLRTANSTKSPKTVKAYAITMNSFIKFIEEEKKVIYSTFCPDMAFSIDTINEWLEYLNMKRGCLPQTCNARLSALRTFLSYLGHKNIRYRTIYYDALTIGKRRTTKNKVQSLGSDVIKAIINTPDINTPAGCRDSILMSFLYTTACRIDEALSMKVGELNLSARKPQVVIIGKGNKIRPLYITKKLADNLKKYIKKKIRGKS